MKTLAIIKPNAVKKNAAGEILAIIERAGFKVLAIKMLKLSKEQAAAFYEIHKEKSFFAELLEYMTSGSVIAIALWKDNAVEDFRKLIGNTDPAKAAEGTIRQIYGESLTYNSIHGSDSPENGEIETNFFFSKAEIVANQ